MYPFRTPLISSGGIHPRDTVLMVMLTTSTFTGGFEPEECMGKQEDYENYHERGNTKKGPSVV